MKDVDYSTYEYMRRRAAFPLLQRFSINRYELWLLVQLNAHLRYHDKVLASKDRFLETVTANKREQAKMRGYYSGLLTKRFIGAFEYVSKPGSESCGISDLGAHVLNEYNRYVDELVTKFAAAESRRDARVISFTDRAPVGGYFAKSA